MSAILLQVSHEQLEQSVAESRAQLDQLARDNEVIKYDAMKLKEEYHAKCEELRRRAEVSMSECRCLLL